MDDARKYLVRPMITTPVLTTCEKHTAPIYSAAALLKAQFPEQEWVIRDIVPVGLTALVGRPKAGKSHLALLLARAAGSGATFLGRHAEKRKVLFLALEDTPRRIASRLRSQGWSGNEDVTFRFSWPDLTADGGLSLLQDEIRVGEYGLIIIDTLSRAARYDQDDVRQTTHLWGNLQQIAFSCRAGIVVVDHMRKTTTGDAVDDLLGSTGKSATVDAILGLYRERGKAGATLTITGRDIPEQSLSLEFCGGTWQYRGTTEEVELQELQRQILNTLRASGSLHVRGLACLLNLNPGTVSRTLEQLHRRGLVVRERRGHRITYSAAEE